MKIKQTLTLAALGIALAATASWAQTTPTGTINPTTYPQGAIATDSMPAKASRSQKRTMKQNRKTMEQNARMNRSGTTNTSPQDARYRESSASDGTAINNSNTTNYNSNNVTNAPTGAGSNPNTKGVMSTTTSSTSTSNSSTPPKQ